MSQKTFFSLPVLIVLTGMALSGISGENRIANSSFELGFAGGSGGVSYLPVTPENEVPMKAVIDRKEFLHGKASLRLENDRGTPLEFLCSPVMLDRRKGLFTFSAYLKADRELTASLSITCVSQKPENRKDIHWDSFGRNFKLTREWKRYAFSFRIPNPHYSANAAIILSEKGTLWADALQLEEGGEASAYQPKSPIEAAILKDPPFSFLGEKGSVSLCAVNASDKPATLPFEIEKRDPVTGYRNIVPGVLEIPANGTAARVFPDDSGRTGYFHYDLRLRSGNRAETGLPAYHAVLHRLPEGKTELTGGFTIGTNSPHLNLWRSWNGRKFRAAHGMDFRRTMFLHRQLGVRLFRLFHLKWLDASPRRGVLDYGIEPLVLSKMASEGIEPLVILGLSGFDVSRKPGKKYEKVRNWYISREARVIGYWKQFNCDLTDPDEKDFREYVRKTAELFGRSVKYYEFMNEPNLGRAEYPQSYVNYLRITFETLKRQRPDAKLVGICATGDHQGGVLNFTDSVGKCGAFRYLDILSFHPYEASLDNAVSSADIQQRKLKALCAKYGRPDLPVWNTECFYIHPAGIDHDLSGDIEKSRITPEYYVRHLAILAGNGITHASSLKDNQLFANPWHHPQNAIDSGFIPCLIPSEIGVAQNTAAHFLEQAHPLARLDTLCSGVNGYVFRNRTGTETAVFWPVDREDSILFQPDQRMRVFDLYGNPVQEKQILLKNAFPIYVTGKNLPERLRGTVQPERPYGILGVRAAGDTLAVNVINKTAEALPLGVKVRGLTGKAETTIPPGREHVFRFRTHRPVPEKVTVLAEDSHGFAGHEIKVLFPRGIMRSGERIRIRGKGFFTAELRKEGLFVSARVLDPERGSREKNAPWTGDCVELYLDTEPDLHLNRSEYKENDSVHRIFLFPRSKNNLPAGCSGFANSDSSQFQSRIREDADGYDAEILIPWKALKQNRCPDELGFDIVFNDNDSETRNAMKKAPWAGSPQNCVNRFLFGRLVK